MGKYIFESDSIKYAIRDSLEDYREGGFVTVLHVFVDFKLVFVQHSVDLVAQLFISVEQVVESVVDIFRLDLHLVVYVMQVRASFLSDQLPDSVQTRSTIL